MVEESHPVRVLHIVDRMNRGGVEMWLMHLLRTINREEFQLDILVHSREPGEFDEEIRQLGSEILFCPRVQNPIVYAGQFMAMLRRQKPYQIIHSHVHHFSGFILLLSALGGIPVRISHSHSDSRPIDRQASFGRKIYLGSMRRLINRYATLGLAVSAQAANALKHGKGSNLSWKVLPCGIDLSAFAIERDKTALRKKWKISEEAFVIGHVGNFVLPKNHEFLLSIFSEIVKRKSRACLLLIGDGPLRSEIEILASKLQIAEKIRFLGVCQDVPALLELMDLFVFPSRFEGLPLAVIEAQAAGLPVLLSSIVTREVNLVPGLMKRLSLQESPARWAEAAITSYEEKAGFEGEVSRQIIEKSSFNILNNVRELEAIYTKEVEAACCDIP